jgi:HSP20 family protein
MFFSNYLDFYNNPIQSTVLQSLSEKSFGSWKDNGESYSISLDLPGVDKDSLEVEIHDRQLTLRTKKDSPQRKYNVSILLPRNINRDAIEAKLDLGVLDITIPKRQENKLLVSVK